MMSGGHATNLRGAHEVRPLKIHVQINGKPYEVEVELEGDDCLPTVPMGPLGMPPIQSEVLHTDAGAPGEDVSVCRSPLTGIVVRVDAHPGAELQPGDPVMVLEAMKMETNVTAATAAKVKCVNVAEGEAVRINQVLVEFEEPPDGLERRRSCS